MLQLSIIMSGNEGFPKNSSLIIFGLIRQPFKGNGPNYYPLQTPVLQASLEKNPDLATDD